MQDTFDTAFTLGIVAFIGCLSVITFSRTDLVDPTGGLANGTYQRSYESRFETSIPTNKGAVSLWAAVKWALFQEPERGAVAGRDGWLFTAEEFTAPKETRNLAEELRRVKQALSKDGITLLPVIIPDKARVHEHRLARGRSDGFTHRLEHALEIVEQAGLSAVVLQDALQFEASFMRTDTHWSPSGARRAAEVIANAVTNLALPKIKVETEATGVSEFEGDLLPFVPTGRFRAHIGPANETIETFETTVPINGGLFGDTSVPVALVGTSYSAKSEFHFVGFLKHALQTDVLNVSRIGQGPFKPMDAFLKDRTTLSSLPTLVIWEIPERFLTNRSQSQ